MVGNTSRCTVTYSWEAWKDEMAWMTLYFSVAVWTSISLVFTPWLGRELVAANNELPEHYPVTHSRQLR
jgi:hypothetical protein